MRLVRRLLLGMAVVLVLGIAAFLTFAPGYVESSRNAITATEDFATSQEAEALHATLIIGDWHADPLLWKRDLTKRGTRGHVDIPRLIEGNVALQVFTAVTKSPAGQNYQENDSEAFDNITPLAIGQLWPVRTWNSLFERAVYQAQKLHFFAEKSDGQLRVIKSVEDLDALLADRAAGQSLVGGILGIEGAHPLEGDINNLQALQDEGYRLIGLQHFFDNDVGGSLHGVGNKGLTPFGRDVVQAIVDRGLILDIAHSSPQVAEDVLAMTDIPLVVSHTGLHSHCQTPRNFQDDLMKRIAATGGVIGMGYWADVTCDDTPMGVAAAIKAAVDVVGEDHVSLGSDYDGSVATAFDTSQLSVLTSALLDVGLTETQIRKVMGENMMRVVRARLGSAP